jgi:hypothetical protein
MTPVVRGSYPSAYPSSVSLGAFMADSCGLELSRSSRDNGGKTRLLTHSDKGLSIPSAAPRGFRMPTTDEITSAAIRRRPTNGRRSSEREIATVLERTED